jgi:hypothetical protein
MPAVRRRLAWGSIIGISYDPSPNQRSPITRCLAETQIHPPFNHWEVQTHVPKMCTQPHVLAVCSSVKEEREEAVTRSLESNGPFATILLHNEIVLAEDVNIKFHLIVVTGPLRRPQFRWNVPPVMHDIDRKVRSVVLDHPRQARRSCPCKTDRGPPPKTNFASF